MGKNLRHIYIYVFYIYIYIYTSVRRARAVNARATLAFASKTDSTEKLIIIFDIHLQVTVMLMKAINLGHFNLIFCFSAKFLCMYLMVGRSAKNVK